jgi:hypothetical protein
MGKFIFASFNLNSKLIKQQGNDFFDHFDFWAWNDPTHGTVSYQSASNAWNQGLISINGKGNAIMTVDQTEHVSGGRKAVRIHGKKR